MQVNTERKRSEFIAANLPRAAAAGKGQFVGKAFGCPRLQKMAHQQSEHAHLGEGKVASEEFHSNLNRPLKLLPQSLQFLMKNHPHSVLGQIHLCAAHLQRAHHLHKKLNRKNEGWACLVLVGRISIKGKQGIGWGMEVGCR